MCIVQQAIMMSPLKKVPIFFSAFTLLCSCSSPSVPSTPEPSTVPTRESFSSVSTKKQNDWELVDSGLPDRTVYTKGDLAIIITQQQNGEVNCSTITYRDETWFSSPDKLHNFFRGDGTDDGKTVTYTICEERGNSGFYSPTSYGYISYIAPSGTGEETIKKMDDFIASM